MTGNPLRALFRTKSQGPLGSLITAYLRDGGDALVASTEEGAMRVAAVMSCVRLIAETVASIPLHGFVRLPNGGKERLRPTNSLERLLRRPNAYQTPLEFREQLTAHLLLRGNAYAYIEWQTQVLERQPVLQAVALHPLNPDHVEVALDDATGRIRAVRYFLHKRTGAKDEIPADDIFHVKGLSSDGITGRSVLTDARETFAGAMATQRYANKLFENDATPGVVLEHPGRLTKAVADRIRDSWDAAHAGNARKTAVLEEGMKVSRLSVTPDEAQFLETRQFQRSEIAGLFRVPPHLIGDVDRSTSWGTGIEQQQIAFLVYTIRPWLERWEQAIQRALVLREDEVFVEHVPEALLRGDIQSRYVAYVQAVNNGLMTPNEVRSRENLNPLEGGDQLFRPANIVPIDAPVESTGSVAA